MNGVAKAATEISLACLPCDGFWMRKERRLAAMSAAKESGLSLTRTVSLGGTAKLAN